MMLNSALHYSTRTERGSDVGFSSALCLPCTLVQVFQVRSGDSEDFQRCQEKSGSSEVNLELECHPERGEHRGQV